MGTILIAFERESEQSALEQLLSGRGHRVMKSANGLAALDAARREPPQAIVSDIVLPRMDGFALCRKWKQDERLQAIPFLFYTRRHDDPKYERFALELGAERFLARSLPPESLLSALEELLATSGHKANPTTPLPVLDTIAMQRAAAQEKAQAEAVEKARRAPAEALEKAQRAHAETLEQTHRAHAEVLDKEQRAHAEALEKMQRAHADALDRARRMQAEALEQAQQAHNAAMEKAKQDHRDLMDKALQVQVRLRAQLGESEATNQRVAAGEARFRKAFEGNPLPMWITDHATSGFIAVNEAALALYGYTRAEFLALKSAALQLPGAAHSDSATRAHRRKDGAALDVALAARDIEFDGRSADLVCAYDLTQRLRTERQMREQFKLDHTAQRQAEFLVELFKQSESFDESAIVRRVIEQAMEVTGSPLGYLFFVHPADRTMALAAWHERGRPVPVLADAEPQALAHAGLFLECVRGRHPVSGNDASSKPQPDGLPDLQRYLAVPMISDDEVVAVLGVANRDSGYGEEEQRLLAALADGVWRVLHSKRAHLQTLSSLQRTDVALQGMIDSFVRMSERHDPYTAGSARRLAALAVALGREAGLDGERQHALRVAALLHDVGNIAVPQSILCKPAPLTDTEAALMRTHVEEGCQLLAEIDFGAPIADIIYQSHERDDGSGYPRGLKGDEILLEARILAIADTVEAMCSPRPYRPALGMDAAIEEINRAAGRLYDLKLVTACTRLIRQHGFALPE